MIDCAEYRRILLAEPGSADPRLAEHRAACATCSQWSAALTRFEDRLERSLRLRLPAARTPAAPIDNVVPLRAKRARPATRGGVRTNALRVPKPSGFGDDVPEALGGARPRWLSLVASLVVAAGVGGLLWLSAPRESLATAVVAHMAAEPDAWRRTDTAVATGKLDAVLASAHVRLLPNAGLVSYANSCEFRGHQVPHVVVQDSTGPVTVMILEHESVAAPVNFAEAGYRGVLVPVYGHGALAVLTRTTALDPAAVERIATRVMGALEWTR
jgi:ABC-type amino acid transport substrate-binding protein